jgi:hypothetical protein
MLLCLLGSLGCQSTHQQRLDHAQARMSFVSWNLRAAIGTPQEACSCRAFELASLSSRELGELMKTQPAPDLNTISGSWYGINKGLGPALAGITQDIKVFNACGECVQGHNIVVHQVPISELGCRGWRPELDPTTCQPKRVGNFVAVGPQCYGDPVQLDYTIAENPWYDPSKILIDELVVIDSDLMLGRADAKIGNSRIPIAYFVLFRPNGAHPTGCDATVCDQCAGTAR